jgi:hypothetical protein
MVVGPAEVRATRIAEVAGRTAGTTGPAEIAGRTAGTTGTAWPTEVTLRWTTGPAVFRRTTRTALWRRAAAWTTGATLHPGGRVARCGARNA